MDKNLILRKMEEIKAEFQKLQERKNSLQAELVKIEQEAFRIDGKYIAYNTMLQETEAMEEAKLNEAPIEIRKAETEEA